MGKWEENAWRDANFALEAIIDYTDEFPTSDLKRQALQKIHEAICCLNTARGLLGRMEEGISGDEGDGDASADEEKAVMRLDDEETDQRINELLAYSMLLDHNQQQMQQQIQQQASPVAQPAPKRSRTDEAVEGDAAKCRQFLVEHYEVVQQGHVDAAFAADVSEELRSLTGRRQLKSILEFWVLTSPPLSPGVSPGIDSPGQSTQQIMDS